MTPVIPLFLVIFLEGYVVLSTELLAIRLMLPFTGSGTDTVSIIIAAVLLPLALGYYAGGRFRPRQDAFRHGIRDKLVFNLVTSGYILTIGLSYLLLDWFFILLQDMAGIYNRLLLTSLYAGLFLVTPVFLLGQTVPLVSNYFLRERLSRTAGRILFFSTLGSFMGAVFATLVLMTMLGVHHTATVTIACVSVLVFILARRKFSFPPVAAGLCLVLAAAVNSGEAMERIGIVSNNLYNTAQVTDHDNLRLLRLNRTLASAIQRDSRDAFFDYAVFIETNFIGPVRGDGPVKDILVLGAGGFTLGRSDRKNRYVYVDIDKDLKRISEDIFLREKISPNKSFVAMDARAYLGQAREKFDLVIVDLFRDPVSAPENLTTVEFFQMVRDHLKDDGVMVGNYFASPLFNDRYSRALDLTLRAVYPDITRQIIRDFNAWQKENDWANVVYVYAHRPENGRVSPYTDNKSTIVFDKPDVIPH